MKEVKERVRRKKSVEGGRGRMCRDEEVKEDDCVSSKINLKNEKDDVKRKIARSMHEGREE